MNHGRRVVVLGGGIAATSCVEALLEEHSHSEPGYSQVVLVSASRIVKRISDYQLVGRQIEKFTVIDTTLDELQVPLGLKFSFIEALVEGIDYEEKRVKFRPVGSEKVSHFSYDLLCICLGATPRPLRAIEECQEEKVRERIVLIRDLYSVKKLKLKLESCRRVAIVGNGGIGLELVNRISHCSKVWLVRDESIGLRFLDPGAAKFLLESPRKNSEGIHKSSASFSESGEQHGREGPSLGPDWTQDLDFKGNHTIESNLDVVHNDQVSSVESSEIGEYPLKVITSKGVNIDCDLIIFGIGVVPNTQQVLHPSLDIDEEDGGIVIDDQMRTSASHVYAAGDVVSCKKWPASNLWFQMRLWTQARKMGYYAGKCIASHASRRDPSIYFNFDCFTHCTSFFNHRVILLGQYNKELLAHELLVRVNPGRDYVKVLVDKEGRIFGAVLIGESGLEETIENLILDGIDISPLKDKLLDDSVDIADYFD